MGMLSRAAWRLIAGQASIDQVVAGPRIHVESSEPLELTHSAGPHIHAGLAAMGHQVQAVASIGGDITAAAIDHPDGLKHAAGCVGAAAAQSGPVT